MNKKGYIKEDDSFINYKSLSYYKMLYFNNYEEIVSKLKQIISETDYTFITYNNLFINPYIHIVNNGHTDKKENVPYLQEIKSLWDLLSPLYLHRTVYKTEEIANIFNTSKENILNMKITSITPNGCIKNIKIGNTLYDGESFINKLNLPSLDITIIIDSENISFINRGNGNNLGLSIEGSKYLANVGCNYLQILNYYFPKCRIKKYAK
jgi:SpoIID/LytB domain protein